MIRVEDLFDADLDYWVGVTEGRQVSLHDLGEYSQCLYRPKKSFAWKRYHPSSNWGQAGDLIEREHISLIEMQPDVWQAMILTEVAGNTDEYICLVQSDRQLTAAMQCVLLARLGETFDPDTVGTGTD